MELSAIGADKGGASSAGGDSLRSQQLPRTTRLVARQDDQDIRAQRPRSRCCARMCLQLPHTYLTLC